MTDEERSAKIAELQGLIAYYQGVYDDLEEEKTEIETNRNNMNDYVSTPLKEYDLSGGGVDWQGLNYGTAHDLKDTISSNIGSYDSTVGTVLSEIAVALQKISDKIQALQNELNSLL